MTILSVSAGLLLILVFHIGFLPERLAECHLRLIQFHFYFVFFSKGADDDGQVLVSHAIEQRLTVLRIIDRLDGQILIHHLRQRLRNLILISLFLCLVCHIGIRSGDLRLAEQYRSCLCGQCIAGLAVCLSDGTDIACVKFGYFDGLVASHDIELVQLLFGLCGRIIKRVIRFDNAGAYLDQRIFSNERIGNGFKNICRFRL